MPPPGERPAGRGRIPRRTRSSTCPRQAADEGQGVGAESSSDFHAEYDQPTTPLPASPQLRVRARLNVGSWTGLSAPLQWADERRVDRDLGAGHDLDAAPVCGRDVNVEIAEGDAVRYACSGLSANARRCPLDLARTMCEDPDLRTSCAVIPEGIKGPAAATTPGREGTGSRRRRSSITRYSASGTTRSALVGSAVRAQLAPSPPATAAAHETQDQGH